MRSPSLRGLAAVVGLVLVAATAASAQPAPAFDHVVTSSRGGLVDFHDTIYVDASGAVLLDRTSPSPVGRWTFRTGMATVTELRDVAAAFAAAGTRTLPATIDDTSVTTPGLPSLRIDATAGGVTATTTVVKDDHYLALRARLEPLVRAVRAIGDRLAREAEGEALAGPARLIGGKLYVGGLEIVAASPVFGPINAAAGTVVACHVRTSAATPGRGTAPSLDGRATGTSRVVRSPSASAATLAVVRVGDPVVIRGWSADHRWYEVRVRGTRGWLAVSAVALARPALPAPPAPPLPPPAPPPPGPSAGPPATIYGHDVSSVNDTIVYVIDRSGAMDWDVQTYTTPSGTTAIGTRLDRVKAEVVKSIAGLGSNYRFEVIAFDCAPVSWANGLRAADLSSKQSAIGWVMNLQATGARGTGDAVTRAFSLVDARTVVLATSGEPSCGSMPTTAQARVQIRAANTRGATLAVFGIGATGAFKAWCLQIASDNGGTYNDVP